MEIQKHNQQQQLKTLSKSTKSISVDLNGIMQMSVYSGELTMECIAENQVKLLQAFPALTPAFHDILADRLKANNYCDARLKDAVDYVIDNCIYPTPTIAQFISFDKLIKLYTYNQVLKMNDEFSGKVFQYYKSVRIGKNEFPVYAHLNDIKACNLELWNNENNK